MAFWAHVGGFIAGVVLVKVFERPIVCSPINRITGSRTAPADGDGN